MSSLFELKKLALKTQDKKLQRDLSILERYMELHDISDLKVLIADNSVSVFDSDKLLLKVSTQLINKKEEDK